MGLMPDFVLDYVSDTTFWTILLILHGLCAIALLGALTHQAMSVLSPVRHGSGPRGVVTRLRSGPGAGYTTAVCVMWLVTYLFGAWIYTKYRMYVRVPIEGQGFWKTQGMFDLKEHLASMGGGLLPICWYFWTNAREPAYDSAAKWLTFVLAAFIWYMFCMGHIVNNVRGL